MNECDGEQILMTIRVEQNGDHMQVYRYDRRSQVDSKLGNITPDGTGFYDAVSVWRDHPVKWQNLERALAYLISPRGMA